jgi:hypothetical protein
MNWLKRMDDGMAQDSRPIAMPVFAGRKLGRRQDYHRPKSTVTC